MFERSLTGGRPEPLPDTPADGIEGLDSQEVIRRRSAGKGNELDQRTGRSVTGIIRANTLTRFNAIVTTLTLVVLVFGEPIDAVFGFVMVLNSAIGIGQELRAKRSLDSLQVLLVPSIGVIRDGELHEIPPAELVLGDAVRLRPGDQIPVDGRVLRSDGLEVDESALTGESNPIPKPVDAETLSGSFVIAGTAVVEATAVGADSWASKLTAEAKDFVLTKSELRVGVDRLLTTVGWLLPPISALLLWSQLGAESGLAEGLVSAVAGVVGLVPQGLVLLVSMTFAIAVIRLARNQVVVQELPAVEGLARVDVLCVDKTGTLTTGRLTVDRIVPVDREPDSIDSNTDPGSTNNSDTDNNPGSTNNADTHNNPGSTNNSDTDNNPGSTNNADTDNSPDTVRRGLAALSQLETARSATTEALRQALAADLPEWPLQQAVPFSSVRKWSGATFAGHGTWILGAPEVILDAVDSPVPAPHSTGPGRHRGLRSTADAVAADGRRVLLVARSNSALTTESLPDDLRPAGMVVLKEEVRPDAAATIEYFRRQHVEVKVLSGDNPRTVAAVAAELGIDGAENHVNMRSVTDISDIPPTTTVFGRVLPEQKRDIVQLLQRQGRTVAMTGDGVNDIPALKAADIGIAMNTATPATKAISQLVLLDGRFDHLPRVVGEGRRVIANMERVSSLFVTKTVYAALLAVIVGVAGVPFPFLPRHLSLIGALTIGIPGFVLSFLPSDEPCRPGYLRRVLRFSIPAGIVAATATFAAFWGARSPLGGADLTEARTAATMALTLTGLWILYRLIRPLDRLKAVLLFSLTGALALTLLPAPWSEFYALRLPPARTTAVLVATLLGTVAALQLLLKMQDHRNGGAHWR